MQKGLIDAARKYGVKLIFFASFGDSYSSKQYGEFSGYDAGDYVSFDIPDLDDFDGVIKLTTYFSYATKVHLDKLLSGLKIPVVNIGGIDEKLLSICCDNKASFEEIVEHLVECHGCKDFYHLAGDKVQFFTAERLGGMEDVLARHGIPFDEDKVYYGNLWYNSGEPALEYILDQCEKRGTGLPDAVVCANDYSAIGFVNACKSKGIRVPEDVIVTGYDAVFEARSGFPTITTLAQPFYKSGYAAVETILKMIDGEKFTEHIRIKGELICAQSCGCKPKSVDNIEDFRAEFLKRLDNSMGISQSTTNLMLRVSSAGTIEECFREIAKNAKTDTGFKDMLICMAPDWDKQRIAGENYSKEDEEMTIVDGYRGDEDVVPNQTFRKKDILPREMLEDPNPYYIFAIHHLQYYMGYLIVTPDIDYREQKAMQSWFVDLGVILESRRITVDLAKSVARLKFLYNRDMLTEIYNRRGLEEFFGEYHDECVRNKTGLAVIAFDMDGLKTINDNYGHNEGDYAIKTIAYGLTRSINGNEVCARAGGDEFIVLAKNYTEELAESFIEKVRTVIEQKVILDGKEFKVEVSSGVHIEYPEDDGETDAHSIFERCLKEADQAMYSEKRLHKGI